MARFDDYAQAYQTMRMERRQGILQITFHIVLRYSRVLLTQNLKRLMHDLLGYGLALEGLGVAADTPNVGETGSEG